MVVQLMKYGADPSLIDGEGCSCVHLAAQFGHTSIVAYLIAKGQVDETKAACFFLFIIPYSLLLLTRFFIKENKSIFLSWHCQPHMLCLWPPSGGAVLLLFYSPLIPLTVSSLSLRTWTWWTRTAWLLWCGRPTGHTGACVWSLF